METIQANTVVIGAGPGGYAAAIRLGQLGIDTVLIEKEAVGGTCLNVGCIPSKALLHASGTYAALQKKSTTNMGIRTSDATIDWAETITWKDKSVHKLVKGVESLIKANKVRQVKGMGRLVSADCVEVDGEAPMKIQCENVLLAMGSQIVNLKDFPVDHTKILNSTDLLALRAIPKSLIILGGGVIGMELGTVYANLGTQVTVVEALEKILLSCEVEASRLVEREFKKIGGKVLTRTRATSVQVQENGVQLQCEQNGESIVLEAEMMAVAVGRRPNFAGLDQERISLEMVEGRIQVNDVLQTSIPNIYAIGDLIPGPMLAHKATAEGVLAAEAIAGQSVSRSDIWAIPDVVYTKPEVASVGLSVEQAEAAGYEVKQGKFPFMALGRASSIDEGEGYLKYIADEKTDRVLGCVVVSHKASELIGEATQAIEMGATLEDIALTVHAHPTFGEAHMEAAAAGLGKAIHTINR